MHSHLICVFQSSIDEMRQEEANLELQMREQCDDYKELLNQKMARDMEIAAYRSDVTLRFLSVYHVFRDFSVRRLTPLSRPLISELNLIIPLILWS